MKYNKLILSFATTLLLVTACKDEEKLPIDFDAVTGTNGAYMRVLAVPSGSFNPFDMANSSFVIELEAFDNQKGKLLQEYRFYVDFADNSGGTVVTEKTLVKTVPASAFSVNATSGLPRATVTITADEALTALGITAADVAPLDEFIFDQELEMTDGRVYTAENTSGDITGGAFFGSPFNTIVPLVCPVDEDLFVGEYEMTVTDSEFGIPVFEDATVELEVGDQPYQRVFDAIYLEGFGIGNGAQTWIVNMVCESAFFPKATSNLGCGAGSIVLGPLSNGTYDETDDSSFTVTLTEGYEGDDGGCGLSGASVVTITFTKVN